MLKQNNELRHDFDDVFTFVMSKTTTSNKQEQITLSDGVGRVLAEDLFSPISVPAWRQSAMDGYGFSTLSSLDCLPVKQTAYAGNATLPMSKNEATHIMTGAVVPDQVDTIVPIEKACIQQTEQGQYVFKPKPIEPGRHIKPIGSDVREGQKLLSKGHVIRPQDQALLASVGINQWSVFRRITVAILTSGNELVSPGAPLEKGQIYDANAFLIESLCQRLPVDVIANERLVDDEEKIKHRLAAWQGQVDVILTVGGASVGEKDFMKASLASCPNFWTWKLNMKPGKPFSMAISQQTSILALPGNPLAAFMTFQALATPFIQKKAGIKEWQNKPAKRVLASDLKISKDRLVWCQVLETEQGVTPILNASSSQLMNLVESDGYIRINPGQNYQAGDVVDFWGTP
ncbi:molybdopterin molybdotransferase MoeA [Hydrogenovibrio sp. 3SP14C1]|uniref:molybdopterin molybdotransferase MoeA n=1 Tax=Hydrogenovibrio sp. 3SP14C1 TaxID=3038774 RepID=UPI002415EADA|nr:molybdopterin molybdotransferase MoeA [Hydrogenovibrio sp. 3SP14C1]MDG4813459.1 molybdopterin molybdotransferase MoeA [Hydrogenovibrio sp. 3SP14C1]